MQLCRVERGTLVLDVASGTGETACFLAKTLGARVVGVDASDDMIERGKRKAAERKLDIEFKKGDAHRLPFGEDTFDAAISECTTCILNKPVAIGEMVRVVKPAGYVGIHDVCWRTDTPDPMKQRLAEIEGERPETLNGWGRLFEEAGLVDVKTVDKSSLIPTWTKDLKRELRFGKRIKLVFGIIRMWGLRGLKIILESEQIFRSPHTGYGIIVGQKPSRH